MWSFLNVQFPFIKWHGLLIDELNGYNLLLFGYGKPFVALLQILQVYQVLLTSRSPCCVCKLARPLGIAAIQKNAWWLIFPPKPLVLIGIPSKQNVPFTARLPSFSTPSCYLASPRSQPYSRAIFSPPPPSSSSLLPPLSCVHSSSINPSWDRSTVTAAYHGSR